MRRRLMLAGASLGLALAPTGAVRAEDAPGGLANPLRATPLETLSASRDRPLFSPGRRPPPVPAPEPEPVAAPPPPTPLPSDPPPPPFTLVGTIMGGEGGIGIVLDRAAGTVSRLRGGEEIAGWRLIAVEPRAATFRLGDRTVRMELPAAGQGAPRSPRPSGRGGDL